MTGILVQIVVSGNSLSKSDQTGSNGKLVNQSRMLSYSVYSRLGNKFICDIKDVSFCWVILRQFE